MFCQILSGKHGNPGKDQILHYNWKLHPLQAAFGSSLHLSKVLDLHVASELAFFLAIVPFQSKLFASYRISLSSWETNVVELDATFHPHGKVLSIPETEDARVIIYDDKIWLIDNHVDFPRKMTSWDNSVRVTLDESRLGASFFRGKNWAPFVYNKNLYFVYSLEPLRILLCIWPDGRLEWVYGQDSKSDTDKLYVRGGSNAIVFNGHVYGVGRESFYIKRQDCFLFSSNSEIPHKALP